MLAHPLRGPLDVDGRRPVVESTTRQDIVRASLPVLHIAGVPSTSQQKAKPMLHHTLGDGRYVRLQVCRISILTPQTCIQLRCILQGGAGVYDCPSQSDLCGDGRRGHRPHPDGMHRDGSPPFRVANVTRANGPLRQDRCTSCSPRILPISGSQSPASGPR